MNRFERYWFGPVAAIRPFLFYRVFLLILAFDVWTLRVPRGARFVTGGFEVAHFGWLDALQPAPTAVLFVTITMLTGLLALVAALAPVHRLLLATLFVLYSYSWMMSQSDSFQHHYLLSLVLLCVVCFPRVRRQVLTDGARVSAWAFVLLSCTIAITYFWTSLAKFDGQWLGGHTLRRIAEYYRGTDGLVAQVSDLGLWPTLAIGTIVVELILAAVYPLAVVRDRTPSMRLRRACGVAMLLAVGLHLTIEWMGFKIGWFSSYMIFAALAFLTPESWLVGVRALGVRVATALVRRVPLFHTIDRSEPGRAMLAAGAIVAGLALIVVGQWLALPGSLLAGAIAAIGLWGALAVALVRGKRRAAVRAIAASAVGALAMGLVVGNPTLRFRYHSSAGRNLQVLGQPDAALVAYRQAFELGTDEPGDLLGLLLNMGGAFEQTGDDEAAVATYGRVLDLDPQHTSAHLRSATVLNRLDQPDHAIAHYLAALEGRPDDHDTRLTLATLLIPRGRLDEAIVQLEAIVEARPDWPPALTNLALVLAAHPDPARRDPQSAVRLAEQAARVTEGTDPRVLGTLAEVYVRVGRPEEAQQVLGRAVAIATSSGDGRQVERLRRQAAGYGFE